MRLRGLRIWISAIGGGLLVGLASQSFAGPAESQSLAGLDDETRTHARPLLANGRGGFLESSAARSLLPYASPSLTDGLRYVDMPSFNDWYSLTLQAGPSGAEGSSAIVHHGNEGGRIDAHITAGPVEHFHMPPAAYRALVQRVDALVRQWSEKADGQICMDGVTVAFERVHLKETLSGVGNASCSEHYGKLQSVVFVAVAPYLHAVQMPCLAAKPSYRRVCAVPATRGTGKE